VTTNATTQAPTDDSAGRTDGSPTAGVGRPGTDGAADDAPRTEARLARSDRRALAWAWTAGSAPVVAVFTWLLMAGAWAPLQRQFFDDFFDHQARAFLDGRWDLPPGAAGFEGFVIDGRTYIYFGPFPALLRIPLFLVTDRFDGRLTTISMFLAMIVLAVAAHRLNLAVRELVRGTAPVTRVERLATAGLAVAVLGGIPLWLASVAAVFHEAILWGLALTVAALASTLRWLRVPTGRGLAATAALTAAAVASRQPLGLALLTGLGLLALVVAVSHLAARRSGTAPAFLPGASLAGVVLVCIVGGLACAVPNLIKFGDPIGPPIERHIVSYSLAERMEFLEANDGSYFSADFVPTTVLQYGRPDALAFQGEFPWIDFPPEGPRVLGGAVFDSVEWASSVPSTMPALVILAVPGAVWLVRAVRRRDLGVGLLALWVGSWAGAVGALTIGYVGHRYLGDMAPIVIVPALCGAHVLLARAAAHRTSEADAPHPDGGPAAGASRSRPRRVAGRVAVGVLAGLVVFGAYVNLALGIQYQRERGFNIPEEWRTELAGWRADLPGVRRTVVEVAPTDDRLPRQASDGTLAVVGDCLGLYQRVGDTWYGIDRGPGVGVHDIRVDLDALDDLAPGVRAPLVTFGDGPDAAVVGITRLADGRVQADVHTAASDAWRAGWPRELDGEVTVRVVNDPRTEDTYLRVGRHHLNLPPTRDPEAVPTVGALPTGLAVPGVEDRYPGDVAAVPFDDALCREASGVG
jgi:hypothetical protein